MFEVFSVNILNSICRSTLLIVIISAVVVFNALTLDQRAATTARKIKMGPPECQWQWLGLLQQCANLSTTSIVSLLGAIRKAAANDNYKDGRIAQNSTSSLSRN